MKLLLFGATGLLGAAVASEAKRRGHVVAAAARSGAPLHIDITDDDQVSRILEEVRPDLIFNCAGLVDVAACEQDPALAYRTNARPVAFFADWSRENGRRLVHISTDHFFTTGDRHSHSEQEPITLVNEYARTKYAGEVFALTSQNALVLRTSIVGIRGWTKPTFAEWAIASIERNDPMTLFDDAYTSSLDAGSCARAAMDLAERQAKGLINVGASEVYTKSDFIRILARQLGLDLTAASVGSIGALRPARASCLGLDVSLAQEQLGYELPRLNSVVAAVVKQLKESRKR